MIGLGPIDWGNMTEGLGAFFGLLAVAWAIWATRGERTLTREALDLAAKGHALDQERWAADILERERAQASLIACEVAKTAPGGGTTRPYIVFSVGNSSRTPIFDIHGFVVFNGVLQWSDDVLQFLNEDAVSHVKADVLSRPALDASANRKGATFRDNAGLYWAKYTSGHLVKLQGDHAEQLRTTVPG